MLTGEKRISGAYVDAKGTEHLQEKRKVVEPTLGISSRQRNRMLTGEKKSSGACVDSRPQGWTQGLRG